MDDKDIVITSAFRTPIGSYLGSLSDHTAVQLGTEVIKKCIEHSNLKNNEVDMVYMGQVLQTGSGQNPARQSLINAGIENSKTATTINQVCGSGLAAVALGFNSLKLNDAKVVIAGGQESMTNSPHYQILKKGEKSEESKMKDSEMTERIVREVSSGNVIVDLVGYDDGPMLDTVLTPQGFVENYVPPFLINKILPKCIYCFGRTSVGAEFCAHCGRIQPNFN